MKIFISNDIEGLAGITHWRQEQGDPELLHMSLHYQIKWVIEGVQNSESNKDISEITICDSHGSGTNLSYFELSQLDSRISLISGSPRDCYMMSTLDESYSMVYFVGYHAGHGLDKANLDHSFASSVVQQIRLNNQIMNETSINAAYAGELGVPVTLIVGDSGLFRELEQMEQLGWVQYVMTKKSLSRTAAKFVPAATLRENTITAVKQTLHKNTKSTPLYKIASPYNLEIDLKSSDMADQVERMPGTIRDNLTIQMHFKNMKDVVNAISSVTGLAATAK